MTVLFMGMPPALPQNSGKTQATTQEVQQAQKPSKKVDAPTRGAPQDTAPSGVLDVQVDTPKFNDAPQHPAIKAPPQQKSPLDF